MEKIKNIIDPFGTSSVEDYSHLFTELGIQPLKPLLPKIKNPSTFMRRGIDFGHQDFDKILEAVEKGQEVAVMSGIKPTAEFHLGSKMTAEKIIYFQKEFKAKVFYCVADLEAYCDNDIPLDESIQMAVDNVADILALGLDAKNAYIYRQSEEKRVMNLAYIFSKGVTMNALRGLYGKRDIGLYFSALTQAGDILMPQLPEFDGPKPVLVPIGADQSPHMFLVRDLARKFKSKFEFVLPSAIYHKFFRALTGEAKMSKRDPMSYLTLNDKPELAREKIMNTFTGGRGNVEEQRRLGGEPKKCVVYELGLFHFIEEDKKIKRIYEECKSGEKICGDCKKEMADIVVEFLKKHQKKKKKMIPKAKKILKV